MSNKYIFIKQEGEDYFNNYLNFSYIKVAIVQLI